MPKREDICLIYGIRIKGAVLRSLLTLLKPETKDLDLIYALDETIDFNSWYSKGLHYDIVQIRKSSKIIIGKKIMRGTNNFIDYEALAPIIEYVNNLVLPGDLPYETPLLHMVNIY